MFGLARDYLLMAVRKAGCGGGSYHVRRLHEPCPCARYPCAGAWRCMPRPNDRHSRRRAQDLVVGQKGRTITLDRGSRLTFFADGTFIDCNSPKLGHEGCDTGTYSLEADKVMRTYDTWLTKQESPLMLPIVFKKEGPDAFFNAAKIIGRTEEPTLLLATREQILGLAGKTFKEYYRD